MLDEFRRNEFLVKNEDVNGPHEHPGDINDPANLRKEPYTFELLPGDLSNRALAWIVAGIVAAGVTGEAITYATEPGHEHHVHHTAASAVSGRPGHNKH
ncbi:MAG TPA: hypothetical protein VL989_02075 [Candidatus Sulfotelmatobacter sp.]|nr:hypothetical protein [Candidatus Sulfotelmatobacter sp.]